jgi:hypothetical protein
LEDHHEAEHRERYVKLFFASCHTFSGIAVMFHPIFLERTVTIKIPILLIEKAYETK